MPTWPLIPGHYPNIKSIYCHDRSFNMDGVTPLPAHTTHSIYLLHLCWIFFFRGGGVLWIFYTLFLSHCMTSGWRHSAWYCKLVFGHHGWRYASYYLAIFPMSFRSNKINEISSLVFPHNRISNYHLCFFHIVQIAFLITIFLCPYLVKTTFDIKTNIALESPLQNWYCIGTMLISNILDVIVHTSDIDKHKYKYCLSYRVTVWR